MTSKKQTKNTKATLTWNKINEGGYVNDRFGIFHGVTKAGKPSKDFIVYRKNDRGEWVAGIFRGTLTACKAEAELRVAEEETAERLAAEVEQRPDPSDVTTATPSSGGFTPSIPAIEGVGTATTDSGTHTDAKLAETLKGKEMVVPEKDPLDDGPPYGQPYTDLVRSVFPPKKTVLFEIDGGQPLVMSSAERRTSPRKGKTKPQERKRSVTINRIDWSQLKPNTKAKGKDNEPSGNDRRDSGHAASALGTGAV